MTNYFMQPIIRFLFILLVPACYFSACTKQQIAAGSDARAGIYFVYTTGDGIYDNIDSLNYSFVEKNSTVTMDTLWLPVRIAGSTADHDRPITLAPVAAGTTAVAGVHYKLMQYTMPKDSFQTSLGVVLIRDASLQDTSYVLNLQLQTSNDFPVLMKDTLMADGRLYGKNSIKIIFTDRLIKPSNWDTYLITFFGSYSDTKFRFIAEILGVSSFPSSGPNALKYPQLQYYQNVVRNALVDYNAAHGPLIDENGNAVVFP
jgi:hypothetical protein